MPGDFHVRTEQLPDATVIVVSGELDLASAPQLEAALRSILAPVMKLVVLDLRKLEFMDSTGLSTIVHAHQRLAEDGCELTLVKGPPQVQRLLDLTGVAERLRLGADPAELLDGR